MAPVSFTNVLVIIAFDVANSIDSGYWYVYTGGQRHSQIVSCHCGLEAHCTEAGTARSTITDRLVTYY